jgi:hypothetical protein
MTKIDNYWNDYQILDLKYIKIINNNIKNNNMWTRLWFLVLTQPTYWNMFFNKYMKIYFYWMKKHEPNVYN